MVKKKPVSPALSPSNRITVTLNRKAQGVFGRLLGKVLRKGKSSNSLPSTRLPAVTPKRRGRIGRIFSRLVD
jgi:hypothetical protein